MIRAKRSESRGSARASRSRARGGAGLGRWVSGSTRAPPQHRPRGPWRPRRVSRIRRAAASCTEAPTAGGPRRADRASRGREPRVPRESRGRECRRRAPRLPGVSVIVPSWLLSLLLVVVAILASIMTLKNAGPRWTAPGLGDGRRMRRVRGLGMQNGPVWSSRGPRLGKLTASQRQQHLRPWSPGAPTRVRGIGKQGPDRPPVSALVNPASTEEPTPAPIHSRAPPRSYDRRPAAPASGVQDLGSTIRCPVGPGQAAARESTFRGAAKPGSATKRLRVSGVSAFRDAKRTPYLLSPGFGMGGDVRRNEGSRGRGVVGGRVCVLGPWAWRAAGGVAAGRRLARVGRDPLPRLGMMVARAAGPLRSGLRPALARR